MSLTKQLRAIRKASETINGMLDALQTSDKPDPRSSMNPTRPLRNPKRGAQRSGRAFRFRYCTITTSFSLSAPVHTIQVITGLNQLDAEVTLRQSVRKQGLYLHSIIAVEPA